MHFCRPDTQPGSSTAQNGPSEAEEGRRGQGAAGERVKITLQEEGRRCGRTSLCQEDQQTETPQLSIQTRFDLFYIFVNH